MARILVVGDGRRGKTAIAEMIVRLESGGHAVTHEPEPAPKGITHSFIAVDEHPADIYFRRERDYPTLKQGLRMPKIRRGKK